MDDALLAQNLYNAQFASFSEKQTAYPLLQEFRRQLFSDYMSQITNKKVLFAGCGDGRECIPAVYAQATSVVGIDISNVAIEHAKNNCPGADFFVMDMEKMSFEQESFDIIISFFAIMYKANLLVLQIKSFSSYF
jgi:ubiquinone/menaquinone biosynthesis C-methylase UbiE